jgi:hypothetical protein
VFFALVVFAVASVGLYLSKQGGYTASATAWVEPPLFADVNLGWNRYISPAQNQTNVFNEKLRTRQFTLRIAQRAGIPMESRLEEDGAVRDIQQNLWVEVDGSHLVRLTYTSDTPDHIQQVISQAIGLFVEEMNANIQGSGEQTLEVRQQQLQTAEEAMNEAKAAYEQFIKDHPEYLKPGAPPNPDLTDLEQAYNSTRGDYQSIMSEISQLQAQLQTGAKLSDQLFRVVDPATQPEPYKTTTRDLLKNSVVALALAVFAMIGIALVSAWMDPAIYTLNDVTSLAMPDDGRPMPELLLGIVPYIPALAALRRKAAKESKRRTGRAGRRKPQVTVVNDTGPAPRHVDALEAASSGRR